MEYKYIKAVVNGKEICAQLVDGGVTGIDAWTLSLCGISVGELEKLIAWFMEIKDNIVEDKNETT